MSEALVPGTMIAGKYRVKRLLGQGGMGAVYEGEHVEIGKRVAIKVIDTQHAGHDELATRFRAPPARSRVTTSSRCSTSVMTPPRVCTWSWSS